MATDEWISFGEAAEESKDPPARLNELIQAALRGEFVDDKGQCALASTAPECFSGRLEKPTPLSIEDFYNYFYLAQQEFSSLPAYQPDHPNLEAMAQRVATARWRSTYLDIVREIVIPRAIAPNRGELRETGDRLWAIGWHGGRYEEKEYKGFWSLRELLANPDRDIDALSLRAVAAGTAELPPGSADAVVDQQAIREYREKIRELEEELAEAERMNDVGRVPGLRRELEDLQEACRKLAGLGQTRSFPTEQRRASVAVAKNIDMAIRAIRKRLPDLADHLDAKISRGLQLRYAPDQQIDWDLAPRKR